MHVSGGTSHWVYERRVHDSRTWTFEDADSILIRRAGVNHQRGTLTRRTLWHRAERLAVDASLNQLVLVSLDRLLVRLKDALQRVDLPVMCVGCLRILYSTKRGMSECVLRGCYVRLRARITQASAGSAPSSSCTSPRVRDARSPVPISTSSRRKWKHP